tara:strand:+ start:240 stop:437 length:198 start_codon:yes stop_codon:yes gene_type:complete
MPTLDDAPTIETLACSAALTGSAADSTDVATELHEQDLVQVYDVSEQKAKVVTLELLAKALNVTI